MAISPQVSKLMNEQINKELYSAYLYLEVANFFEDCGLRGYANWYEVQAKEEVAHAHMFRRYLLDNDIVPTLEAINAPEAKLASHMDALKLGLDHERYVTSLIHAIYAEARNDNDFRSMHFLDYFITEQMEEEVNAEDMIKDYQNFGDKQGLFQLDAKYAARAAAK